MTIIIMSSSRSWFFLPKIINQFSQKITSPSPAITISSGGTSDYIEGDIFPRPLLVSHPLEPPCTSYFLKTKTKLASALVFSTRGMSQKDRQAYEETTRLYWKQIKEDPIPFPSCSYAMCLFVSSAGSSTSLTVCLSDGAYPSLSLSCLSLSFSTSFSSFSPTLPFLSPTPSPLSYLYLFFPSNLPPSLLSSPLSSASLYSSSSHSYIAWETVTALYNGTQHISIHCFLTVLHCHKLSQLYMYHDTFRVY